MFKSRRSGYLTMTVIFFLVVFLALFLTMIIISSAALFLLYRGTYLQFTDPIKTLSVMVVIVGLGSTTIGSLLTALMLRMPLNSINRVIDGLNRLTDGQYDTRIEPETKAEKIMNRFKAVEDLNSSFNQLALELENNTMLRSDFINNFSHEFKTPIVSIAGFAKLLKRGNLTEAQKREYLDIIEEESLRLSEMATNTLNLTKVESQTILTDVTEFNLSEQLRTCVLLLENNWERKHLGLELDFEELRISGSEELLKQVWINLLDNAVKFADEGSLIRVSAAEDAEHISVTIENEGPEIPPAAMPKIFNKFYQADESHAAIGSGVGLAIVKRVADLHGGSVSAVSGKGKTAFTVTLPR